GQDGQGLLDGFRVVNRGDVQLLLVHEKVKLAKSAAEIACRRLLIHGLTNQKGVHIVFFSPGLLRGEPAAFQLQSTRHDFFLLCLELVDQLLDLISQRRAGVAICERPHTVMD
ncbi:MAG: hypothetical protein ACK55I_04180, partial [bacterium]